MTRADLDRLLDALEACGPHSSACVHDVPADAILAFADAAGECRLLRVDAETSVLSARASRGTCYVSLLGERATLRPDCDDVADAAGVA